MICPDEPKVPVWSGMNIVLYILKLITGDKMILLLLIIIITFLLLSASMLLISKSIEKKEERSAECALGEYCEIEKV